MGGEAIAELDTDVTAEPVTEDDFASLEALKYCQGLPDARMRIVVALLARGKTAKEAGAAVGVTQETVSRWRAAHPDIDIYAAEEADALYEPARRKLAAASSKAADVWIRFVNGDPTVEPLQAQGAKALCEHVAKTATALGSRAERRVVDIRPDAPPPDRTKMVAAAREWRKNQLGRGKP